MNSPHANDELYLEQLSSIEQLIGQNNLQDAVQRLNRLGQSFPRDPRLFLLGSRLAEAAGNPDGMLQAARKAHELAPAWPTATIHLAQVHADRGDVQDALAIAERALRQPIGTGGARAKLLTKAVDVAQRVNLYPQALQWLREASEIDPDDENIRYKIGLCLTRLGEPADAIGMFNELLLSKPDNPSLLSARMQACLSARETTQAIRDGEALLALDPANEEHQFYLDVARGLTPRTQPASVIVGLFDGYAARFDREVVGMLKYKLPREVAHKIKDWHPDLTCDILDLGCGTGLLGACLGPMKGVLVGVDLSARMIEQASRHRVYDRFHQVNLLDALHATPGDLYHIVAALDVFGYVGDLDTAIADAYRILLPGGRLVFSCEVGVASEVDYVLQDTYHYAHGHDYVNRLLRKAGFGDVEISDVLRHEATQSVQGFLVIASKPA